MYNCLQEHMFKTQLQSFVCQGASYAVGNAAFHNDTLYLKLKPAISQLVDLLKDPVSKTRINAACKFTF